MRKRTREQILREISTLVVAEICMRHHIRRVREREVKDITLVDSYVNSHKYLKQMTRELEEEYEETQE